MHHRNRVNQIIHYVTIPLIIFCVFCFINYIPLALDISDKFGKVFNWNVINAILLIIYGSLYLHVDAPAALLFVLINIIMIFFANLCVYNVTLFWIVAIAIFILSWICQIIGHYWFECNQPTFCKSLIQAFLIAPLFVLLEVLFMCNYNPELQQEISVMMDHYSYLDVNV